jgi:hypothetical protein
VPFRGFVLNDANKAVSSTNGQKTGEMELIPIEICKADSNADFELKKVLT